MSRARTLQAALGMGMSLWALTIAAAGETRPHVRDPDASFVDVAARREALKGAQSPRLREAIAGVKTCTGEPMPEPPPKGQEIPSRYLSGSHGAVNAAEQSLSQPYYRVQEVAARGANRYLVTGDAKEAACVIAILLPWAKSRALLDYDAKDEMVVWFQSTWTVASLSLAVSVVRAEPSLNIADRDAVIAWLREAAKKAVHASRGAGSATANNNHFFWRGLAAAAAGVISNDDGLFGEGLRTYAAAIAEIDAQGAFPEEMKRHELALHYQAFAIEPLVMIAELARRQGLDIYGLTENRHTLADAVDFLARAMADPGIVKRYTPDGQQMMPDLQPGQPGAGVGGAVERASEERAGRGAERGVGQAAGQTLFHVTVERKHDPLCRTRCRVEVEARGCAGM